jgi:hypothetical protein
LWSLGLALAGVLLSAKDIDWSYDSTGHKVFLMLLYGGIGALMGMCLSVVAEPAHSLGKRSARLICWTAAFALLGLAVGHGNVPWLVTLRFIGIFTAIGVAVGILQFLLSSRTSRMPQ